MAGVIPAPNELEWVVPCSTNLLPSKTINCFKIRSRPVHTSDTQRKGPMIARIPAQVIVPVLQYEEQSDIEKSTDNKRLLPSPSATNVSIFGSGDTVRQQRKRSPSLSHSRGSSPSGRGRGSSPGGLDPSVLEAVKRRVQRVQQARLYLLQQPGPNSFLVGGDSPEHKYKVVIGPQSCSCGRDPHCLHLLFVMLRVFQVPESDSRIYSKTLKNYEVESLFQTYQERRNSRVCEANFKNLTNAPKLDPNCVMRSPSDSPLNSSKCAGVAEEDLCPICLLAMTDGESLVSCTSGCRNKLHHHCMAIWAAECYQQGEAVLCPLCRKVWTPDPGGEYNIISGPTLASKPTKVLTPTKSGHSKRNWVIRGSSSAKTSSSFNPFYYSDYIPLDQLASANDWMKVLGKDLVSCLYSKDWKARECGLRELAMEVETACQCDNEEHQQKLLNYCARILSTFVADSVFKVYLAWVYCFRVLLNNTTIGQMNELIPPIVRALLSKCADHNRRNCQLSIEVLLDFAKGQNGSHIWTLDGDQFKSNQQFELILNCIVEDFNQESVSWQWLAGRLIVLDCMIKEFPNEFWLQYIPLYPNEAGYKLQNYNRLMTVVEFAIKALNYPHSTVNKLAKHVFIVSCSMTVKEKGVMKQVYELLLPLEPDLQIRLRKKLQEMIGEWDSAKMSCQNSKQIPYLNEPGITDRSYQKVEVSTQLSSTCKKTTLQRPKDLPLTNLSKIKLKNPVIKFYHEPVVMMNSQKKWNQPGLKLYNLFTKGKKDNLLPNKPDLPLSSHTSISKSFPQQTSPEPVTPDSPAIEEIVISLPVSSKFQEESQNGVSLISGLIQLQTKTENNSKLTYTEDIDWQRGLMLGAGGSSTCFQARDIATGTLMAVKQVSFCRNSSEEQSSVEANIEEEMAMMSTLNHPNIVRLLGATKQGKHFNMFVEWMAGGSVANLLDKFGPFTNQVILHYTMQVVSGLNYLHQNHILHRDLKGANLLVDSTGQRLRIGDFGAAIKLGSKTDVPDEFQCQLLGTIAFMAPEALRGEEYNQACDIWSLGCCIIEMATTEPPWRENNVSNHLALIYKIACTNEPPKIPESLSNILQSIVLTCLNMDPELRPSAKELLQHCPGPGQGQ
uniref:Mitogen-activated protein kinase kinase kinase n=1 Tax=Clastoptera arizonana TaxID=38151 RepID=A0A1B6BZG6_9HEMI